MIEQFQTSRTDNAVCPYCGHVHKDSWEFDFGPGCEGDGEVMCHDCGKEFICSRTCTIHYSTLKKK